MNDMQEIVRKIAIDRMISLATEIEQGTNPILTFEFSIKQFHAEIVISTLKESFRFKVSDEEFKTIRERT